MYFKVIFPFYYRVISYRLVSIFSIENSISKVFISSSNSAVITIGGKKCHGEESCEGTILDATYVL